MRRSRKLFAVTAADRRRRGARTALLVPRDTPGLTVRAYGSTGARQHGACGEVTLTDCRVAGRPGARRRMHGRSRRAACRRCSAAINLGIGRAAHEAAIAYAQLRVQGGRPHRRAPGDRARSSPTSRSRSRSRAARCGRPPGRSITPTRKPTAAWPTCRCTRIARAFTAEAVYRAAKDAAECFGAMGVMRDMPLQKFIQDARICLHVGEGVSDAKLRHRRSPGRLSPLSRRRRPRRRMTRGHPPWTSP